MVYETLYEGTLRRWQRRLQLLLCFLEGLLGSGIFLGLLDRLVASQAILVT